MSSLTLAAPSPPGDKEAIYSIQRTMYSYSTHGITAHTVLYIIMSLVVKASDYQA